MQHRINRRSLPRHFRGAFRLIAVALVVGLTACGGGGADSSSGAGNAQQSDLSSRHYLPAAVGDRWLYADSGTTSPVMVKATGSQPVNGQTGVILRSGDGTGSVALLEDAQGVKQIPVADTDALTAAIGQVQLLRYPLRIGDTYSNVSKSIGAVLDFDGDGLGDPTNVEQNVQVVALETVAARTGTLSDCLHVRTTTVFTVQSSALKRSVTLTLTVDDWLAPGIGLVKSQQVLAANGNTDTFTREIVAYGVGSQRSENMRPSATAPGLSGAAALGPRTSVDVAFDEDMDQDSLGSALTVVDGSGRVVTGTVSISARGIHFTPASPWSTGSYSARLAATATDLVGNPVAAAAWNFTIDATAPTVVGTQPLEGAVDVALASHLVLQFSEPVLASSVNATTIQVLYDGSVLTQVSYQVNGTQVTLTPQTGLARGKRYSISIHDVTDLAGNSLTATQIQFTSDPGRFGAPAPLPVPVPGMQVGTAVAVGDINGDGRADVVAGTTQFVGGPYVWESQLAVYPQRADGSLGAAVLLPIQAGAQPLAIVIADINGDGLNDLVVAEASFGVQLFVQTTDGRLVADQVLNTGTASLMKVVDMNGDGRPDIVIFGSDVVRVWLNLPGGWTLVDTVTVTTDTRARDMAVGDINGDGRPDVVVVGDALPGYATAGVLRQGADGRLSAPEWLFDGNHEMAFNVAIADFDGTGRSDIVLSLATGLRLVRQQTDGTLAPMSRIDDSFFPGTPLLADINGDGRQDILTVDSSGTLAVRLRQADATWAAAAAYPGSFLGTSPSSAAIAVGDIDGDGRPDVVAGGNRFIQRAVPMMSQSVGSGQPSEPSRAAGKRIQAAIRATASAH